MAKEAKVNYSEELTAAIVQRYTSGESVEAIAASIGKAVRSVRAKLVREGVYVPVEKPKAAAKDTGPTKKELLRELEALAPAFPIEGFVNATKEALTALIDHLQAEGDAPADDESVAQAA
jgi:transposase-like protein